jgi:nucleotide-binding universal stress UspA family protein
MSDLPTKILLAIDGSASSVSAAHRAAGMAHAFGAELQVVHVMPVTQPYHLVGTDAEGPSIYEEDKQWAQELLDGEVRKIEEEGANVAKTYFRTGEPDAEVVALGEDIGADMIVVGSRGMGRLRRPIGSVSSSIVAHAHCPVLVVRGGAG